MLMALLKAHVQTSRKNKALFKEVIENQKKSEAAQKVMIHGGEVIPVEYCRDLATAVGEGRNRSFCISGFFSLNFFKAEAMKQKEAIKGLYDAICSGDASTSSSSPSSSSGAVCRGITYSKLESLLRVCYPQMLQALSLRIFLDAY
ncbi:uncharacterized protein MONOS_13699 [Monocercomonoides exilis]|uniref:uncharacterized protein n=1 Tax=Monocercomonoides exilis TaxID=2049356 RepID=UPI00355AB92A|nr:hypothetical protein MONOS_13699 [Monocercomonoides exilis]|eukprot:MONOS_13699.1-p1 / transcript=MONOS_13699.1 / gene=MONOS_13699 / organism=Monocercomonoides_exilis_PA203 / gene_product=unspecified product / transcript_product=unspecified product / location=Mono_scaffold00867:6998-7557(-) / protein_length=146 / sequence_SO=supercontig / SO=protein_coding / is_pseudo=false